MFVPKRLVVQQSRLLSCECENICSFQKPHLRHFQILISRCPISTCVQSHTHPGHCGPFPPAPWAGEAPEAECDHCCHDRAPGFSSAAPAPQPTLEMRSDMWKYCFLYGGRSTKQSQSRNRRSLWHNCLFVCTHGQTLRQHTHTHTDTVHND